MCAKSFDFNKKLESITEKINIMLDEISAVPVVPEKSVCEAMRYSLLAGGKRIRPVLTVAVAELFGGDLNDAVLAGCALECVHTYSLIHDDLPCMDDDDLRRGKPTCHKVFPENIALLAGDGLLTKAFELLSGGGFKSVDSSGIIEMIKCLSLASGIDGMIGGQVIDLESENKNDIKLNDLYLMHSKKTGALINAATRLGSIVGGVLDPKNEKFIKIYEFSSNLGLAFQIKDDILDVTGSENLLGKPIGSDDQSGKNTFVTLLGIEKAEEVLRDITDKAIASLDTFGDEAWFLRELAIALLKREK